jgi:hypothetical protein
MMRPHRRTLPFRTLLAFFALFTFAGVAAAQAPQPVCTPAAPPPTKNDPAPPDATSGIRIAVTGPDGKPLQRKRFYLLERDVTKDGSFSAASAPKRDDFLAGASAELRAWLKKYDCDSLYCPEYEAGYEEAVKTVPEFKAAYDEGMKKYKNPKLALRWVTVNFPLKNVRTEYYNRKKAWLDAAAQKGGGVMSVMTDEKGVAYFTGVKLRTYYVSNLVPLEDGNVLWNCEVAVPPPLPRQLYSISFTLTAPKAAAR